MNRLLRQFQYRGFAQLYTLGDVEKMANNLGEKGWQLKKVWLNGGRFDVLFERSIAKDLPLDDLHDDSGFR